MQEDVITAGKAAKLAGVSNRTLCKWFDTGKIKGYRVPESTHRRIIKSSLLEFLKANGMPIPSELVR